MIQDNTSSIQAINKGEVINPNSVLIGRFFHAFSWTSVGYIFNQFLRLLSNIILARLFLPHDFGVLQLVYLFIQAIAMFSDLGVGVNIIQHKKGEDDSFLRTAWSLQILRGLLIEFILIGVAFPIAEIYHLDILKWLIPLAGLSIVIDSFVSTNWIILNRKLHLKTLTIIDILSQVIGILVMIIFAWYFRAVWTLVVASLVSVTIKAIYSHFFLDGPRMKFEITKNHVHELIHFGKWIFVSTITGFLLSKIDRVIISLYTTITILGLYGIAYALAMMANDFTQVVGDKVLLPYYSNLWRNQDSRLRQKICKIRLVLMLITLIPLYILFFFGQNIIQFLYPPAYWGAGWMLQTLAIACCFKCIVITIGPILLAAGNSFRMLILMVTVSIFYVISLTIGGYFYGVRGIIWAIPISEILNYPILVWAIRPYGVWLPWLDLAGFSTTLLIFIAGTYFYG